MKSPVTKRGILITSLLLTMLVIFCSEIEETTLPEAAEGLENLTIHPENEEYIIFHYLS